MSRSTSVHAARFGVCRVLLVALLLCACFAPKTAHAYPWLLRHGYHSCTPCHLQPSGGGPITAYGREIADSLLRTPLDGSAAASPRRGFLFGAAKTPAWLDLGGDLRGMVLRTKLDGVPAIQRTILMQADLEATLTVGPVLASGSLGFAHEGALGAALTRRSHDNLVSREHWLGVALADDSRLILRAGRLNLPFGIRSIEHSLWVRSLTRTNINDEQQYGAALAFQTDSLRGEVMAIAGNLQLRPDDFRERGYSAFVEFLPAPELAVGVSSLVTHRDLDPSSLKETWRQAHGVFARYATPWQPLTLLSEWDYSLTSAREAQRRSGVVGYLQADVEPVQGVHFLGTFEAHNVGVDGPPLSWGTWLSYAWFFAPQTDLRLDGVYQSVGSDYGRITVYTFLAQAHVFL